MKAHLLIVDDEQSLCDLLAAAFRLGGYEVTTATDGEAALRIAKTTKFDLMILDINMPKLDGLQLIERLRAIPDNTPAIVLSAKANNLDINSALRLGADDYVTKPFGLEELSLRVAAILRRTLNSPTQKLTCGPVTMDEEQHVVTVNDQPVELSPTEFSLLKTLMKRQGKLVTKATLLDQVWNIGFSADATVVSTYISYLRKKLHTPTWQGIRTVRGLGFQITAEAEEPR